MKKKLSTELIFLSKIKCFSIILAPRATDVIAAITPFV